MSIGFSHNHMKPIEYKTSNTQTISTIQQVLENQLCVGCGACAVAMNSIEISRDEFGIPRADISKLSKREIENASRVCPFSSSAMNEDALSKNLFSAITTHQHPGVGYYLSVFAGRVLDDEKLMGSSSGGLTHWICTRLLENGHIDGVVHVGGTNKEGELFSYTVSSTVEDLLRRRKSQYYSVSFDQVVKRILSTNKRYAFVGVPCYVKAIRLLSNESTEIRQAFPYTLALVCGHMKSPAFAESLAWQLGVKPNQLQSVDFRVKCPGKPVHDYSFTAVSKDGTPYSETSNILFGSLWGHAAFQLNACDYCDDIFGETADACFGDAWLQRFSREWRGTNILVIRNSLIAELFAEGHKRGEIILEKLSIEDLIESQAGNFRHRWDGLSERLRERISNHQQVPKKRIQPGSRTVKSKRAEIVKLRQKMAKQSHISFLKAKQNDDLDFYIREMSPLAAQMSSLTRISLTNRVSRKIKSVMNKILLRLDVSRGD